MSLLVNRNTEFLASSAGATLHLAGRVTTAAVAATLLVETVTKVFITTIAYAVHCLSIGYSSKALQMGQESKDEVIRLASLLGSHLYGVLLPESIIPRPRVVSGIPADSERFSAFRNDRSGQTLCNDNSSDISDDDMPSPVSQSPRVVSGSGSNESSDISDDDMPSPVSQSPRVVSDFGSNESSVIPADSERSSAFRNNRKAQILRDDDSSDEEGLNLDYMLLNSALANGGQGQSSLSAVSAYYSYLPEAQQRESRIINNPELIQHKLESELAKANGSDKGELQNRPELELFVGAPFFTDAADDDESSDWSSDEEVENRRDEEEVENRRYGPVGNYYVDIVEYRGARPLMEDRTLATSLTIKAGHNEYEAQLFGVFDGHGGTGTAEFLKDKLAAKVQSKIAEYCQDNLTDQGIWNALKLSFVELNEELREYSSDNDDVDSDNKDSHYGDKSGSTAVISLILDGNLWTANVGDSRAILRNGDEIIQLSEDQKPHMERYETSIKKRNGWVTEYGVPRINGSLACARAIGDLGMGLAVSSRPKITKVSMETLSNDSRLILVCDGVTDVLNTTTIATQTKKEHAIHGMTPAETLVSFATKMRSKDNLSALVVNLS